MQYNSFLYLCVFLLACVLCYYIIKPKYRWYVLLIFSIGFYMVSMKQIVLAVLASAATVYLGACWIQKNNDAFAKKRKTLEKAERKIEKKRVETMNHRICSCVCFLNLAFLFVTKYFNFFGQIVQNLLNLLNVPGQVPILDLFIPLGISFYTLTAISYLVDVSRGTIRAEDNYLRVLLFLIFFPCITEGPICRYAQLGNELKEEHLFDGQQFCFGLQLIVWGLFQKVVLSDRVNLYIRHVFHNYNNLSGLPVVVAILLYTFQLYMDFAGCINIARGSAQLFGIELAENFRRPFFALTVSEFWRRWHMTLGSWFKDYVFFPVSMGKNFQKFSKTCRQHLNRYYASTVPVLISLFAVWFCTGIWHGAEWKYIIYGLYYYIIMVVGLILEPVFAVILERLKIDRKAKWYQRLQTVRTFILVNIGMLIFRAKDLKVAWHIFLSVFQPWKSEVGFWQFVYDKGNLFKLDFLLIFASIVFLYLIGKKQEKGEKIREYIATFPLPVRWAIYIIPIIMITVIGAYGPGWGVADFIYAKF